jgi:hypothetical protein
MHGKILLHCLPAAHAVHSKQTPSISLD